jgi:uncharacterized protein (TIGR03086 family)
MDAGTYERAIKHTGAVVAGTTRDQLDNATPCTEWSVRDVLNHLIGGFDSFAAGARGVSRPMDDGTDYCADDHVAEFDRASGEALEGFGQPGALEKEFAMPWGNSPGAAALGLALADAVVHGWDIAKGTGQTIEIEEDIAAELYGMTSSMMEPNGSYPRGDSFKSPVEVPEDASAADKLLAYLGRRP